jgi:hypothetical protein
MLTSEPVSGLINYIYFDVDNLCFVESLEELTSIYYKGRKTIHESVYMCPNASGDVIHSMSSTRENLSTLIFKIHWMNRQNDRI